jgi:hypothetical protein
VTVDSAIRRASSLVCSFDRFVNTSMKGPLLIEGRTELVVQHRQSS